MARTKRHNLSQSETTTAEAPMIFNSADEQLINECINKMPTFEDIFEPADEFGCCDDFYGY